MDRKEKNEKTRTRTLVAQEIIERKILFIRGYKVMLDKDLAMLYNVETRVLNQAVKRNQDRFPPEFIFSLNKTGVYKLEVTICDFKMGRYA